jgi:hypothetical protein
MEGIKKQRAWRRRSARGPGHEPAAQDVYVEMAHGLPPVVLAVNHKPGALFAAALFKRQLLGFDYILL